MQRPLDGRAGAHPDHGAVAHQRGVERDRNVACRRKLAEMRVSSASFPASAAASELTVRPSLQRRSVGQFRHERAVDENQPQRFDIAEQARRRSCARALACASGGLGERLGVAHQRAQIGVFPVLDAAMRQAFARRRRRRRPRAPSRSPSPPGSARRACAKVCASAVSAAVLMTFTSAMAVHRVPSDDALLALTPPPPRPDIRHSRALRARAPDPCRRCCTMRPLDSTCTTSGTM